MRLIDKRERGGLMDIVDFLKARLDEDEQLARDACGHNRSGKWSPVETAGGTHKVVDELGYSVVEDCDVESDPWWTLPHIARVHGALARACGDSPAKALGVCLDLACGGQVFRRSDDPRDGRLQCRTCRTTYSGLDLVKLRSADVHSQG
jgi:hypothetical protein